MNDEDFNHTDAVIPGELPEPALPTAGYAKTIPDKAPIPGEVVQHVVAHPPTRLSFHRWRQRGHTIHCGSCELPHGFHVDPGHFLTGIDERGYPIIQQT